MIRETVSLDDVIDFLNEVLEVDGTAVTEMVVERFPCNGQLADHPTVQVHDLGDGNYSVGVLGLFNGLFGVFDDGEREGCGPITAIVEFGEQIRVLRFQRTVGGGRDG